MNFALFSWGTRTHYSHPHVNELFIQSSQMFILASILPEWMNIKSSFVLLLLISSSDKTKEYCYFSLKSFTLVITKSCQGLINNYLKYED
jgi:hypothetical protein